MKITDLALNNFQIHKELILSFSGGINVLVGESDVGKSAIIRALNLLVNNQPKGGIQLFQNDSTDKPLKIELLDDNSNYITREGNTYTINNKEITTFGNTVPEQIQEILPFKDINFQFQLDSHFLVLETGGKAAEIINQATGLEDQELIVDIIKEQISDSKKTLKGHIKDKEATINKIEQLKSVPHFLMKSTAILNLETEYKNIVTTIELIENNASDLLEIEKVLKKYSNLDDYKINLEKICEDEIELKKTLSNINELKKSSEKLQFIKNKVGSYASASKYIKPITEILSVNKDLLEIDSGIMSIKKSLEKLIHLDQQIMHKEMVIDELRSKLDDTLISLGKCPLCGSIIKGK
jgi:hypothetical protein